MAGRILKPTGLEDQPHLKQSSCYYSPKQYSVTITYIALYIMYSLEIVTSMHRIRMGYMQ